MAKTKIDVGFNYREYAGIGFGVLVILFMAFVGFNSFNKVFSDLEELKENKEELADVNQKIAGLEDIAAGGLDEYRVTAENVLPKEKPIFEVFDSLNVIAEETGIVISSFESSPGSVSSESARPENSRKKEEHESVQITLSVSGEYENMNRFILILSEANPLLDLVEIRLDPQTSENEERFLGEFDVVYYWMPDEEVKLGKNIEAYEITENDRKILEAVKGYTKYYEQ